MFFLIFCSVQILVVKLSIGLNIQMVQPCVKTVHLAYQDKAFLNNVDNL